MSEGIKKANFFLEYLEQEGLKGWIVGGAVRDSLLGYDSRDLDIVLDSSPAAMFELFPQMKSKGKEGRTSYHVSWNSCTFELVFLDGQPLESDLKRRDFTINSMAMDSGGRIIDCTRGMNDLASRVIKFTGEPEKRISEDPSRLIRYCRFASLSGIKTERRSSRDVKKYAHLLCSVAAERCGGEILKVVEDEQYSFSRFLVCLRRHDLLGSLMISTLSEEELDIMSDSVLYLERAAAGPSLVGAAFLFSTSSDELMKKWGWPRKLRNSVSGLLKCCKIISDKKTDDGKLAEAASELGLEGVKSVRLLLRSRYVTRGIPEWIEQKLNRVGIFAGNIEMSEELPGGEEIIERLGISQGILVREVKLEFLRETARGNIKTREDIERVFQRIAKK